MFVFITVSMTVKPCAAIYMSKGDTWNVSLRQLQILILFSCLFEFSEGSTDCKYWG